MRYVKNGVGEMQIYLTTHKSWADVISECQTMYVAKYVDGVMTYVIKDGTQITRNKEV